MAVTPVSLAERALTAFRRRLIQRFGATHFQVTASQLGEGSLRLGGTVLVHSLRAAVVRSVVDALGPGVAVDGSGLHVVTDAPWFRVVTDAALVDRGPAAEGAANLCTQLDRETPVQRFASLRGAALVRSQDGTVGWTDAGLDSISAPPLLRSVAGRDPAALVAAAERFMGAPYVLGGTRPGGIDCSGLVQRACAEALGIVVPRHSKDQVAIGRVDGPRAPAPGDLLFVWTAEEALCHVGIAARERVVHASLSRRRVVSDDTTAFLSASRRTLQVPFATLLGFGDRIAGSAGLMQAGFELGVAP